MYLTEHQATHARDVDAIVRELKDRCEVIDALYRFGLGQTILNPAVALDTTHVVTNCRVRVTGDAAKLTAIVEAQHLPKEDHSRHAMLKNLYAADLIRDGERWVMLRVRIDNVWFTGDPKVIVGA